MFRRQNHVTFISIKTLSHGLLVQVAYGEKILSNVNVFVQRQVKRENSSLPVAVRVSKTRVLKLPNEKGQMSALLFRFAKDYFKNLFLLQIISTLRSSKRQVIDKHQPAFCRFKVNAILYLSTVSLADVEHSAKNNLTAH